MRVVLHSVPQPYSRPPPTHASTRDSCTLPNKSGSVSCVVMLLSPGSWCTQWFVCALPESISQSYVSSGSSVMGLMVTSSKRAYAIPKAAAPRAPASAAPHCWPVPRQETLKHRSVLLPVGSLGPGAHKVCLRLWWEWGLILNMNLPLLLCCWGFSLTSFKSFRKMTQ